MSQSKLFDYNSSFSVIRTNPKLAGNFKISVDSQGGVWFNSMDVNNTLSNDRFKKFNISGQNTYASDISEFFAQGKISNDIIFQVGKFTGGENQAAQEFAGQYDFFYAAGASALIDKNYPEDFSYFAPLWIKNEIPDYFVVFKLDNPLDYPYSKNVTSIEAGVKYKVIQDFDSSSDFVISYGKDSAGSDIFYTNGSFFEGKSNNQTYSIISGSGKVSIYDELVNLPLVNDVSSTFKNKILNNATAIKTFDLGENTKIGSYIRSIFNNNLFSNSPIELSWGYNSYTYYKGASVSEGVYTRKGELLNQYLSSSKSDPMIDTEDYITSGFSRNGIICPNLLNLEFYFDDPDSDLYTINRYVGMYVSRNDLGSIRMNGDFYYTYRDLDGNENYPMPSRNDVGYYYNNSPYETGATSGVRLFYENASGFMPGSESVNILNQNKLFYVTDKNDNFYSLKRIEGYGATGYLDSKYLYGPYDYMNGTFGTTGSTGATCGSLVLQNKSINLLNFTGSDDKLATIKGEHPAQAGRAYTEIEFLKDYEKTTPLTFKLYWPNGSMSEGGRKYDLIKSGDFSSILIWTGGSYYSTGNSYYFNASTGTTSEIASAFASVMNNVDETTMETGIEQSSSITRVKNPGLYGNSAYSIAIFSDYDSFVTRYKGTWDNTSSYSISDIVLYNGIYYATTANIYPSSTPWGSGQFAISPSDSDYWNPYNTFDYSGYVKINGVDASDITSSVNFLGGTARPNNRIVFSSEYSDQVKPGYFIKTNSGFSMIGSVNKYVDKPRLDKVTNKTIGFTDFGYKLVLNLENIYSNVDLGSDRSFNVYDSAVSNIGVFTFFDVKEFNFDFWSSDYSYSPTPETYKYYELQPDTPNSIYPSVPYLVKAGQISYNNTIYNIGDIFYGATGYTSFTVSDPSLNLKINLASSGIATSNVTNNVVVFPAQYSDSDFNPASTNYGSSIKYTRDLEAFNGFLGIQGVLLDPLSSSPTKEATFSYGKLGTEYEYLRENYTTTRANISRIVPYINKWGSSLGTDARGNRYRLNSSPAFSPTNFSPSFDRIAPDPKYLTHEWFLLETPPRDFPKSFMNDQNSYLSNKIDLELAKDANPDNSLYLPSYFTVEPSDYTSEFRDLSYYTKELFTPLVYNQASGYYETIFRGAKVVLKKRSDVPATGSTESDRYVPSYRGYEDYKFSAILRAIPEDNSIIQAPVKYQVIENEEQKFILFVCDVVIKDQKAFPLGYTGGTGGNPSLDYTLLYSLSDKEKLRSPFAASQKFYAIDDIKLSCALDLSLASGSYVNTNISPGRINIYANPDYDTDLREEIHLTYVENAPGSTGSGPSSTGTGSFSVSSISSTYPWPTGVGPSFVEFGKISQTSSYTFNIPFSPYYLTANPVTIPVGPSSVYRNTPVIQLGGGEKYYKSILSRCSLAYISNRFNLRSPYIKYSTYEWDSTNSITTEKLDGFELYFEKPTKITKPNGSTVTKSYNGPQLLKGSKVETGFVIDQPLPTYSSILTRYSGQYEPIFRKVIHFDRDKTDTIIGDSTIDLTFRNCNFAPDKQYFGLSRNLSYTKVSEGSSILSAASSYPEGPVYPLIGLSPIARKDFNIFSSSWDAGYYDRYTSSTTGSPVAGTRSMKEYKTFFGSKVMQTPDPVNSNNYITLQISRTLGSNSVSSINSAIDSFIEPIQSITKSNSGTGIGSVGPYLSGVDYDKLDLRIFPNAELIWQYFPAQNKIKGIIRLDRMLRRYLLNSGVKKVFIDNMISEFGVGNPTSINDDVNDYIDLNVSPLYQGDIFNLYVKKSGNTEIPTDEIVRGDLFSSDRYKMEYFIESNYKLVRKSDLIYEFEYTTEKSFYYSLMFNFTIGKI